MSVTLLRRLYNTLLRLNRGIKTWINSTPLHHAFIFSWHAPSKISNNYTEKKAASRALLDEFTFLICKTKIEKIIFFLSSGGGRYVVTFELKYTISNARLMGQFPDQIDQVFHWQ